MKTVLVIQNSQTLLEELNTYLTYDGYRVLLAQSGKMAIALTHENRPDLVISDFKLCDITGVDVLQAVRQDEVLGQHPFIFFSAETDESIAKQALELGATMYLFQPLSTEILSAVIANVLQS